MNVTIWGCRGSIARSHPSLIKFGGNTPCVEVVVEEEDKENEGQKKETRIVLDMGSGAYDLGQKLVKLGPLKNQNILLTHCHWDHIQGFPFFAPLFIPGSEWTVHAPGGFTTSLQEKLASQMSYEFFPLTIDMLGATIEYQDLVEGQLQLGSVKVTSQYLNHPVLTLGYRLDAADGTSMAYITDHEPFNRAFAVEGYTRSNSVNPNDGSTTTSANGDDRHVKFLKDVDLLIHDAQYTAEEYKGKKGWGHGTIEYVTDIALAANVKTLVLFHHDPQRSDDQVEDLVKLAQERARSAGSQLKVTAAADRADIYLPPKEGKQKKEPGENIIADDSAKTQPLQESNQHVFICHNNEASFSGCKEDSKLTIVEECNGADWDDVFGSTSKKDDPTMFLISCSAKYQDCDNGLGICRRIRHQFSEDIPVFLLAKDQDEMKKYKLEADDSGISVTDWIVEPFTPAYLRTRVRMGISRTPCRWAKAEIPKNELQRRDTLHSLDLSEEPEDRFDAIVRLAQTVLGTDVATMNLLEEDYQWTKSFSSPLVPNRRKAPNQTRDGSFCSHTILKDDVMVVNDTLADNRFADNPSVAIGNAAGMKVRFYAGIPIAIPSAKTGESHNVGSLCVMSTKPKKFNDHEQDILRQFADLLKREMMQPNGVKECTSTDC